MILGDCVDRDRGTDAEIAAALERSDARLLIVANTIVPGVASMRDGRVYAVDVNSNEAASEVLVFEHGQPRVVDTGIARNIVENEEPAFREFNPSESRDRQLLLDMVRDLRRLSGLPYPY